jgi:hypothetical protein
MDNCWSNFKMDGNLKKKDIQRRKHVTEEAEIRIAQFKISSNCW